MNLQPASKLFMSIINCGRPVFELCKWLFCLRIDIVIIYIYFDSPDEPLIISMASLRNSYLVKRNETNPADARTK